VPESILPPSHRYGSALERQLAGQRARRPADPLLSLVVPVFDEEGRSTSSSTRCF
jgi:hypothetical protein